MNEPAEALTAPRRKWHLISWTRVSITLAVILLGPLLVMWFLEPWYFAHEMSRDHASLSVTPETLRDSSASKLSPARLQCFEYSFQAPWEQIESRKDTKTVSIIKFKDGATIMAVDAASVSSLSNGLRGQARTLEHIFGSRALSSSYDWMAAELAATPADIHWWNRSGNVRAAVLLGMKQIETLDSTAIYRIRNDEIHGFQFRDPAVEPHQVTLDLFDVNNRRYELVIASSSSHLVTQADINAIVASFRPIPHS